VQQLAQALVGHAPMLAGANAPDGFTKFQETSIGALVRTTRQQAAQRDMTDGAEVCCDAAQ
jgi:hypothetical protein